jgi:alginate O-acetyltransferase complex protein AlgJ
MTPLERARLAWPLLALVTLACHSGASKFPWGGASKVTPSERRGVRTLSPDYERTKSQVWVREVTEPTRAALDYAAYHANFMIADPEPEVPVPAGVPDTSHPFAGKLDSSTLTGDISRTPLTAAEQQEALAFPPLSEFLQSRKLEGASELAAVGSAVRSERWGLALPPGTSGQILSELYVHRDPSGGAELWAKVEFHPWFKPFADAADQDGDGFPELYGRLPAAAAPVTLVSAIEKDYVKPRLSPADVQGWANQLSSYWYPSFNTDLIPAGPVWPDEQTEPAIKAELGGRSFPKPTIVLRGKPLGKPTYNVLLVSAEGDAKESGDAAKPALRLAKTRPSPAPQETLATVEKELAAQGGGSWQAWTSKLAPTRDALKKRLKAVPPKVKAIAGKDGFLYFRNDLHYVSGGDLERQRAGKNPLPIILEFKKLLDSQGVDFLFVPVPTKLEVYPEKLDPALAEAGPVLNPAFRKLLESLGKQGVEVVDLLPALLRAKSEEAPENLLFQRQDTHWTDRGLRLAAGVVAARVKKYPWYAELAKHKQAFSQKETTFTRFGDLHSRLPEAEQKKYEPETLVAHQVLTAGELYDDDADSPVVLLGDSFTGVYQLTDAQHAGVSAHIAKGISYPLDLVMSYGGGPNVRQKLMRRGVEALGQKKLVIWMMTARDLYDYWEKWEPLKK